MELGEMQKELAELEKKLSDPEQISDPQKLQSLSRRYQELAEIISVKEKIQQLEKTIAENREIVKQGADPELVTIASSELEIQNKNLLQLRAELQDLLSPETNKRKIHEIIMEIRAGVGGEEAALFARDLYRMYSRYAERQGWKMRLLQDNRTDLGGAKEITAEITGESVYSQLAGESGVHRVQRIPETEKSGRVHTSTASVAIFAKSKAKEIEIKPEDLRIDTYRASGPGGQYVNTTSSAVRVTHLPTGLVVASQQGRSQHENKETAMTILRAKLWQKQEEKRLQKLSAERREQVQGAKRAEKIRTYNFPQDRLTDHRLQKNWHNLEKIMDGDIKDIIEAVQKSSL